MGSGQSIPPDVPRKLDQNVSYVACLVPAFDCGVKAGLGLRGGTLAPAWERVAGDENQDITLPVYDYWRFAWPLRRLRVSGWQTGGRPGAVANRQAHHRFSNPRGGITALADEEDGRLQVLQCALHSLAPAPVELASSAWSIAKREESAHSGQPRGSSRGRSGKLRRVAARQSAPVCALTSAPRAAPRRWTITIGSPTQHLARPSRRRRLGTRVVQKDQDLLMQAAWAQAGEIDKVNQSPGTGAVRALHLGSNPQKSPQPARRRGTSRQVTRAVHGKLRVGGAALTVAAPPREARPRRPG